MSLRSRIVDGVFGALELLAAGYDFVRGIQRRVRRNTDPIPLTHRHVQQMNEAAHRAGHETGPAPIPKAPRVPRI